MGKSNKNSCESLFNNFNNVFIPVLGIKGEGITAFYCGFIDILLLRCVSLSFAELTFWLNLSKDTSATFAIYEDVLIGATQSTVYFNPGMRPINCGVNRRGISVAKLFLGNHSVEHGKGRDKAMFFQVFSRSELRLRCP